jgi:hypothetical protein
MFETPDDKYDKEGSTKTAVCGSLTRACCLPPVDVVPERNSQGQGTQYRQLLQDVLCEMWVLHVAISGNSASDHKSTVPNNSVSGANACELANGTRSDVVLFGAGKWW